MGSKSIEAFDRYAEEYDKWFDTLEGKVLFEMEVKAIKLLMKKLEQPFLEVGVGTGRFAKELGISFGVDPSLKMLEIARKRGIIVKKAEDEELPFEDGSFGAAFMLFTLCFVDDPGKVISEAKRVINQGGGLVIGMVNKESPWGQLYIKKKNKGHPIYKYARFYSINEVVKLLEKAGMEVEAYSSTLCPQPSEMPHEDVVYNQLIEDAGFVCILSRKNLKIC